MSDERGPARTRRRGGREPAPDSGASAVEFALVLPILLFVLMLAITGSLSYNRKVSLTHAARETTRWAATLGTSTDADGSIADTWFLDLVARAEGTAAGELSSTGAPGRYVCVAYVEAGTFDHDGDPGTAEISRTWRWVENGATGTESADDCFDDGITSGEPRVQVQVGRETRLDAVLLRRDVELRSEAVARFEHESPYVVAP